MTLAPEERGLVFAALEDGPGPGPDQMRRDAALLEAVEAGLAPPTVRIYGWSPPCLTLGKHQDPAREVDVAAVHAAGFDLVKRPTGGRVVLHIDEITYAVIARTDAAPWCRTQGQSYRHISRAFIRALGFEALDLALERGYPVEKPAGLQAMSPCFSSTARSEIVWRGRKAVGSAQRRTAGAFLQHGSLPLSPRHREIVRFLRLAPEQRAGYLALLDENAVSLEEVLGRKVEFGEAASGLARRFAEALAEPFAEGEEGPEGLATEGSAPGPSGDRGPNL